MQITVIGFVILAICEPLLLDAKKVVVVMPRKHRRSHSSPLINQLIMYAKKNRNLGHNYPAQRHGYSKSGQFYHPKELPFAKDQYPRGGDDFDQGHEKVNHVFVPHGKGITHAVSFGNGYIPYDNFKAQQSSLSHHHNYPNDNTKDVAYSPTANLPVGHVYAQPILSQQADAYIRNDNYNNQNDLQDRNHNNAASNYADGRSFQDLTNSQAVGAHYGVQGMLIGQPVGLLPGSAVPSVTIAGNKQGIVLRDTIAFDQYNRQVAELTKNWPGNYGGNNLILGTIGNDNQAVQQLHGLSRQYDQNGYSSGSIEGQGKKGYAVKEDVVDTAPHDFRTAPIQPQPVVSLPIQIPQQPVQPILRQQIDQHVIQSGQQIIRQHPPQQIIHQQPPHQIIQQQTAQQIIHPQAVQQLIQQQPGQHTLQNFLQQSQVPVNYALQNIRGLVHG